LQEWVTSLLSKNSTRSISREYIATSLPSRLSEDEVKEPRESEPKDRSEDESDPDFLTDTQHSLGFAGGAAGNLFAGSSNARKRGSLVHEVLYRCDLKDPESVAVWARRLCRELGAPDLTEDVARHAKSILESEFMRRVLGSKSVLRELPVSTFDGKVYVEGFADLAFEEDDGWVVMDYKTGRLDGRRDELVRTYTPQVQAYRSSLAAAGMKVKEAGLWFSDTGETWTAPAPR
jgi:ATP-dependent exoDNAse (exonuclease V) beta subunit